MRLLSKRKRDHNTHIGNVKKTRTFWNDVSTWIQSCQVPLQNNHFSMKTALGLKPDSSANKLEINFCCLTSKYYIWLCHSKEQVPTVGNYLQFLKQIYQMEKNTTAAKTKWEPLLPTLQLEP